ncbi:MAG: TadE/TadG family type IV pilus assembly protein [Janthinobacterium lividum]
MLRRFVWSRRGTTALEFALVGPLLLMLVFIIMENGLMLFAQAVLDNATVMAARQIQIGSVTTSNAFRSAVCSNMSTFFDCTKLHFYVASSSTGFPSALIPSTSGTFASTSFSTGSGGNYVLAEVAYNRAFVSPWVINLGGPSWILLSTQAVQNEPS